MKIKIKVKLADTFVFVYNTIKNNKKKLIELREELS